VNGLGLKEQDISSRHIPSLTGNVNIFRRIWLITAEQPSVAAPIHQLLLGRRKTTIVDSIHLQALIDCAHVNLALQGGCFVACFYHGVCVLLTRFARRLYDPPNSKSDNAEED
jgi:hypothetical protein